MSTHLWFVVAPDVIDESFWQSLADEQGWQIQIDHRVPSIETSGTCVDFLFLDADLRGAMPRFAEQMRQRCPQTHFVWLSATSSVPIAAFWHPWSFVRKPIGNADLKTHLDKIMNERAEPLVKEDIPAWLQDPALVARHLTKLTLETSAQATLIAYKGVLWAYAGELSQDASIEVVGQISQSIAWQPDVDLLRFVYLKHTRAQHMLYATRLADEMVLAMVFSVETSFSEVRGQVEKLAEYVLQEQKSLDASAAAESPADEAVPASDSFADDDDFIPDISDILQEVPPPQPKIIREKALSGDALLAAMAKETPARVSPSIETNPPVRRADVLPPMETLPDALAETHQIDLGLTRPSTRQHDDALEKTVVSASANLEETQVSGQQVADVLKSVTQVASHLMLEPASPALYNLHYACLLVTRRADHLLTGDLKEELGNWMRDIAVAYGWRLEMLNIQPNYLQWVVSVPPSTSPATIMRIVRRETSDRILKEKPRFKENLANDFWAPGYLVMGGERPHPVDIIQGFIDQTRKHQDF